MPSSDPPLTDEKERERDHDVGRGDRGDRGGVGQKSSVASTSKSKDLSHVPCKFFKVGGCTAGSSCPFSHNLVEPGGQKETCAWFVKGTCKFGHKCALAHILPGQSMSMDRKNKKAAQLAAAANAIERGEKPDRGGKDGKGVRGPSSRRDGLPSIGPGAAGRNSLLAGGSTAPTRILNTTSSAPTGRPPMNVPLKATLSPSAPAPPLASLGELDDLESRGVPLSPSPTQYKPGPQDPATATTNQNDIILTRQEFEQQALHKSTSSPAPLPTSAPRSAVTPTKPKQDFGPIGSPPTSGSLSSPSRLNPNGPTFSPGTSPQHINRIKGVSGSPGAVNAFVPSSPFSAPGTHSGFLSGASYSNAGGIASSLSALTMVAGREVWGSSAGENGEGFSALASPSLQRRKNETEYRNGFDFEGYSVKRSTVGKVSGGRGADDVVEDGDLEDLLPSSLTYLLTPEERTRRMSRSNSGQPFTTALGATGTGSMVDEMSNNTGASSGSAGLNLGHRYSRSVPAPSLLSDIKSIWSDNATHPSSPPTHRATPPSPFATRLDPTGNHATADEMALSISIGSAGSGIMSLSPSNASAAFLPGLHSHYLNAKAKQAQAQQMGLSLGGLARGLRNTSGPLYTGSSGTGSTFSNPSLLSGTPSNTTSNAVHTHINPHTNTAHTYRASPSPFDLTQQQHQHHLYPHTALPVISHLSSTASATHASQNGFNAVASSGMGLVDDPHTGTHLLSPSTRALQSHAPGQSLPQGLAAGYSRIHALPPPPALASPAGSVGGFGGGTPPSLGLEASASPGVSAGAGITGGISSIGALNGWKASTTPGVVAASRTVIASSGNGGTVNNGNTTINPPGLTRNVSGGRYTHPMSPLSGPVVTGDDDDDLFSMDG